MVNQGKTKRPSIVLILLSLLFAVILAVGGLLIFRYAGLEPDQFSLKSFSTSDTLEVPMRPGVQGIVISGPPLRDLTFEIDLSAAGIKPINWGQLEGMAPKSELIIRAQVLKNGNLLLTQKDVQDGGYPKAGEYLAATISTWKYKAYKNGWIRFKFTPGATENLLIIDANDLENNAEIPAKIRVRNGIMHYVNGLKSKEDAQGTVSF